MQSKPPSSKRTARLHSPYILVEPDAALTGSPHRGTVTHRLRETPASHFLTQCHIERTVCMIGANGAPGTGCASLRRPMAAAPLLRRHDQGGHYRTPRKNNDGKA